MEQEDGTRRCYYDIMNLEFKCTEDEMRRSYKKLSLKYHPDKNINNQAEAGIKFKEVQAAYAVLNDPQERAWYDAHRSSILAGGDGDNEPDGVNLFDFLNPRCYDNFSDGPNGFYTVYNKVFATLAKEEQDHADIDAKGKPPTYPTFGTSKADYATETCIFYQFWQSYRSRKTFAWKDEYKTTDIPDRFTRRHAERHNQKLRDAAKKEFSSLINELVDYVRKRDPRLKTEADRIEKEQDEKEKARVEKQEAQREARARSNQKIWEEAAEIEERRELERLERGEYDSAERLEMLYAKEGVTKYFHEEEDENADDDKGPKEWKCPACKKNFKTLLLWKDHEKSNKHKTKLKQLAAKGTDVDAMMKAANGGEAAATAATDASDKKDDNNTDGAVAKEGTTAAADEEKNASTDASSKKSKKEKKGGGAGKQQHQDPATAGDEFTVSSPATSKAAKKKAAKKAQQQKMQQKQQVVESSEDSFSSSSSSSDDESDDSPTMKPTAASQKKDQQQQQQSSRKPNKKGFTAPKISEVSTSGSETDDEDSSSEEDSTPNMKPTGGKKKGGGGFAALNKKR